MFLKLLQIQKKKVKNKKFKNIKNQLQLIKSHHYGKDSKTVSLQKQYLMYSKLELELSYQMLYLKVEEKMNKFLRVS